jgi:hypothetical protein
MNGKLSKQRAVRREMLWWIAGFVGLQVALALALDYPLAFIRDPNYASRVRLFRQARAQGPDRPAVVLLGSSRTLWGFRPVGIEPNESGRLQPMVFNFSQFGHGPTHQYVIAQRLLRDRLRPDGIIVDLAPHQLAIDVSESNYLGFLHLEHHDLPYEAAFRTNADSAYEDWWQARLVPWHSFRFQLMDCCLESWVPPGCGPGCWRNLDSLGWAPIGISKRSETALGNAKIAYAARLGNYQVASTNRLAIRLLAELCRKERIPLNFLFMPESPEFRSWYSADAQREVDALIDWMRHDLGVAVVDARRWLESEDYFWDGHHLLGMGAATFTDRFAREVLPVLAQQTRDCRVATGPSNK